MKVDLKTQGRSITCHRPDNSYTMTVLKNRHSGTRPHYIQGYSKFRFQYQTLPYWLDLYQETQGNKFQMRFTKAHYQHFTRLYNRRNFHRIQDVTAAGYQVVKIQVATESDYQTRQDWLQENCCPDTYVSQCRWVDDATLHAFSNAEDAVLFKLAFGS